MMHETSDRVDHAAEQLGELLEETQQSIGVAESLTGGLLVQALARLEGSGAWLTGGVVAYQRSVKHELLEVSADKVVSAEAAGEMASAVRGRFGCDVGMAVTGVAGPRSRTANRRALSGWQSTSAMARGRSWCGSTAVTPRGSAATP